MHISWRECADMDTSESTAGNYYDGNLPNTTTSNNSNANNNVQVGMAQGNDNEDAADGSGDIPLCTQSPAAEQVLEAPGVHEQAPNMTYGEELEQDVFPVVATGVVTYGSQTESTAEVEEVRLLTAQTPPVKQEQEQQQQSSSRVGGIPIVPFETPDVSLEFGGECSVPPSSHEVSDRMFWSPTFGYDVEDSHLYPFGGADNTEEVKGMPEKNTGREEWTPPRRSAPKRGHVSSVRGVQLLQAQSARKQPRRGPHSYQRSPIISDVVRCRGPSGRTETCTPDLAKLRLDNGLSGVAQPLHADNKGVPLEDFGPEPCPPTRGQSFEPSIWSLDVIRRISDTLQPLPLPPPVQQQRLRRDQSFPPLDISSGGSRPLSDGSFFPPPSSDVSLLGTPSPPLSAYGPASASITPTEINSTDTAVGTLESKENSRGRGGGSNVLGVKGGSSAGDPACGVTDGLSCFGGDSMYGSQCDGKLMHGHFVDRMDGGLIGEHPPDSSSSAADGGGVGDNVGNKMLSPSIKSEAQPQRHPQTHPREGSFDELAAMIPGLPPDLQPTSASRASQHPSNSKASAPIGRGRWIEPPTYLLPTLESATTSMPGKAGQGRPSTTRKSRAKPLATFRRREGTFGASGDGDGRGNGCTFGNTAGSTVTVAARERSLDQIKRARRKQAIERYLYKMGRRQVADHTREASPSRSRPKAAKLRKRVRGRFVKVVPDFISATADSNSRGIPSACGSSGIARSVPAPAPAAVVQAHD